MQNYTEREYTKEEKIHSIFMRITILHASDDTNLCHTNASESSLQQLLPPGVQTMEFFHHGCRDKSTVKRKTFAGARSVRIVKWESCLTVSLDVMSHGCF